MDRGRKLPAPDFCNKEGGGKANPIFGKGALGNQFSGRMYYTGSDKEEFVTLVQTMLEDLGYDVGSKGADGKFGNDTEKAIKEFQKVHEDWGGEKLNVDGLVGPETSDALNRAMVGVDGWYDRHETEKELTISFALLTVTMDALKSPVPFDVADMEKGKVVLVGAWGGIIYGTGNLIFHVGGQAVCPHGGQVVMTTQNSRVMVNGQPAVTIGDSGTIAGCPDPSGPCVSVQWIRPAVRVLANGQPVILQSSGGICKDASGNPRGSVTIVQIQQRVSGQ
ncbi:MAG: peptidoglycan-binding protein [Methanoregula sp.]|nr:peptidoglycan-binding protein [Methanoregula sp.]